MKKTISILLLTIIVAIQASATPSLYVAGEYGDAFTELKKYEIFQGDPDGKMREEDIITVAEMAKVICSSLYLKDVQLAIKDDEPIGVPETHWARMNIAVSNSMGIIENHPDKGLNPERECTMAEVIKSVVKMLGYSPLAEQRGGMPMGYLAVANQLGITKGIDFEPDDGAKRCYVAQIIYNSLNIPLMEQTTYGENAEYKIMNGENGTPLVTLKTTLDSFYTE